MEALLDQLWAGVQEYAGPALRILLVLILGALSLRYLVAWLRRGLERTHAEPAVASFLLSSARTAILVLVALVVLQQLGIAATSLLAVVGAAGLAVALALQNSLTNFAAGLVLLTYRMVRVGDYIELGDVRGRVIEMLPFHVVLASPENQRITVPNATLANGMLRNHSALPIRRARWLLPLQPGEDVDAARALLRDCVAADPRIRTDPPVQVYVQDWSLDRRTLAVEAWTVTADLERVQQELLETLGKRLEAWRGSA
jgi:small conductance mechanosensitive channel